MTTQTDNKTRNRRRAKPPWFLSEFFLKILLPFFFIGVIIVMGTWGFHDYYRLFESHGWQHSPPQSVSVPAPASDEADQADGSGKAADEPAASAQPSWYEPDRTMTMWDAFLLALGLTSGETTRAPGPGYRVPLKLQIARALGLLVLPAAFFVLAFRVLRESGLRLKIWWWGVVPWRKLNLLCGMGWQGHEIACQILVDPQSGRRSRKQRLAILEKDPQNPFASSLRRLGGALLFKDATAKHSLAEVHVRKAQRIYVVSTDDETNCRIVRQISDLWGEWQKPPCLAKTPVTTGTANEESHDICGSCQESSRCIRCYASVRHPRTRSFLENSTLRSAIAVQTFNQEQLTARRLHARFPFCPVLSQGNPSHAHVVILGATPIAQAILLNTLHIGHFSQVNEIAITVLCKNAEEEERSFHRAHPSQKPSDDPNDNPSNDCAPEFRRYVFPTVQFVELPEADAQLLDDDLPLYQHMKKGWLVSLYVCLDDGVESRVLVRTLRDKLGHMREDLRGIPLADAAPPSPDETRRETQDFDVQVFFYYNYPEDNIAAFDPDLAPDGSNGMRIEHFGGFDQDCSIDVIENFPLDHLARQIMKLYLDDDHQVILANIESGSDERSRHRRVKCLLQQFWDIKDEWEHESSRYAADHTIVKLRCLGIDAHLTDKNGIHYDPEELKEKLTNDDAVGMLSEIEHRRWCAERLLMGWRSWRYTPGETTLSQENINAWFKERHDKRAKKEKRHIDLVPYDQLPTNPVNGKNENQKDIGAIMALPVMLENAALMHQTT